MKPHKGKILVIDDDLDTQEILQMVLSGSSYEVSKASNGSDALQYLRDENLSILPDLIILDEMMPLMNGSDFLVEIRNARTPSLAHIPILLSSGNPLSQTDLLTEMNVTVLNKPLNFEELMNKIETQVAKKKTSTQIAQASSAHFH